MLKVIRSPRAEADITEIWDYIAEANTRAADEFLDQIAERLEMLRQVPFAGVSREELGRGLRSCVAGKYLIFQADAIWVARIIHGKRDLRRIFRRK